jgi:nitroimidazol reductase NimA-like FMN-containing flavoprotein (pyridoxamine 5'-phosphate oxidase superfamily)
MAHTLSDEAADLLTSEPLVGHLATCHDGHPHVAPLWYGVHEGAIELTTTGRKLENVRRNPRVALSVQKADGGDPVWGVTVQGTATVLDEAETAAVRRRVNRRYGVDEDAWAENVGVRVEVGTDAVTWQ